MNLINHDNGYPISIVNTVDNSEPPNFIYTNNFILNEDIREKVLTDKTRLLQGCKCIMCPPFNPKQKCDCIDWTGKNPYSNKGLVNMESGDQIYECNLDCACAKITPCLCRNRVTQRTRKHKLQIYKTPNKGWAVRTLEDIPKGTFISIYTGLVMSLELANQLGKSYETKGFSYLFDLDGDTAKGSDPIYTVDATNIGNFSRFINHSCDPNLYILSVFTDHQDIHNIGLFAKRDIKAQEEICYDYTGGKSQDDNFDTGITCYCDATNCKKVLMM
jgi:histone-lysine N-methyltransferase SUV39H